MTLGIKKSVALKKVSHLEQYAEVIFDPKSSKKSIASAGEKSIVAINSGENISSAAKFHSYRVYYQVQMWLENVMLNLLHWGWNVSDDVMFPRMTDMAPAPDNLLKMVKCKSKTDCRAARFSSKKNGP